MVESIQGWNFTHLVDGPVRLRDLRDAFADGDDVLRKANYDSVGYSIEKDAKGGAMVANPFD